MKPKSKKPAKRKAASAPEKAYIVCTAHRGVFFGYARDVHGDVIELRNARMAVYWSADVRGVVGLADGGPTASCKISQPAPSMQLRAITAVLEASESAARAWESAPWQK